MAIVLVVDDSSFQRKMITRIVTGEGHEVLQAANGSDGVKMVKELSPDCIIMDLLMPEVSGLDALQILRDEGSIVPVIILTSDIQDSVREQCLELGAHTFLNKPPKAPELKQAMNCALGTPASGANP